MLKAAILDNSTKNAILQHRSFVFSHGYLRRKVEDMAQKHPDLLGEILLEASQLTRQRLCAIPFPDPQGHIIGNPNDLQHPFKGGENFWQTSGLNSFWRRSHHGRIRTRTTFPVGLREVLNGITSHCTICGLYDWDVDAHGIHPIGACPFPDQVQATEVEINVPSGKLAVGVSMDPDFIRLNRDEDILDPSLSRLVEDYDDTLFRNHYGAKVWEQYGFAEVQLFSQDENLLYQSDDGGFVLSNTRPRGERKPLTSIFTFMPKFACCDAELFEPLHAARRRFLRKDATFDFVKTTPGRYCVRVVYANRPPLVSVAGTGMRARVTIKRIGDATTQPSIDALRAQAERYLGSHPWMLQKYMGHRYEMSK